MLMICTKKTLAYYFVTYPFDLLHSRTAQQNPFLSSLLQTCFFRLRFRPAPSARKWLGGRPSPMYGCNVPDNALLPFLPFFFPLSRDITSQTILFYKMFLQDGQDFSLRISAGTDSCPNSVLDNVRLARVQTEIPCVIQFLQNRMQKNCPCQQAF